MSRKKILFFLLNLFFIKILPVNVTVGSDSAVAAAQANWFFDAGNNKISNYALMDRGFGFQSNTTSCSYYSALPISGAFILNSGKLFVNRDIVANNLFLIEGGGQIIGNNNTFRIVNQNDPLELTQGLGYLTTLGTYASTQDFYTVDWSYGSNYVAAGRNSGTGNELFVFNFNGSTLSLVTSLNMGNDVNCLRWHPSQNYFAMGITASVTGNEVRIYSFNGTTLTEVSGVNTGTGVRAVAWSRDGNYLAVSLATDYVRVYSYSGGTITYVTQLLLAGVGTLARNSLSWDSTGQYISVGDGTTATNSHRVLYFNGATLTQNVAISANTTQSTEFHPTLPIIAATHTNDIRLYFFTSGSLVENTDSVITGDSLAYSVHWSLDGKYLVTGRATSTSTELRAYRFDQRNYRLYQIVGQEVGNVIFDARWSPNNRYIAIAGADNNIRTYGFAKRRLDIENLDLVLNTDLLLTQTVYFSGTSSIKGNDCNLIFGDSSTEIVLNSGATLNLENIKISGLRASNLRGSAQNSVINLKNCKLDFSGDFNFTTGAIKFTNDVIFTGTSNFNFANNATSSLDSNTILYFAPNFQFNYQPARNSKDLIYMTDSSSVLYLDGCTIRSTNTGLTLKQGSLLIDNKVTLSSQGVALSEIITLGNASQDLDIKIFSDAQINVYGGFNYANAS